ncbi:MAG: HEAT repeat domain-containing protein, partial [Candidatus Latescibacter sp.]|nr:HEAT repeat domain-containing protein [Candidatus Latescibacter sp.]
MKKNTIVFLVLLIFILNLNLSSWAASAEEGFRQHKNFTLMPLSNFGKTWTPVKFLIIPQDKSENQDIVLPLQQQLSSECISIPELIQKIIDAISAFFEQLFGRDTTQEDPSSSESDTDQPAQPDVISTPSPQVYNSLPPRPRFDDVIVDAGVNALIEQLNSPDLDERIAAVMQLGALKNPAAITPLIAKLEDENRNVRIAVAGALSQFDAAAVEPLIAAFVSRDPLTRETAKWALVWIGPAAVKPLVAALGSIDMNIRANAAGTLELIGPAAVQETITALFSTDPAVRRLASSVLSHIPEAVQPLIDALGTTNEDARKATFEALLWSGDRARAPLIAALNNPDNIKSETAAEILLAMGEPAIRDVLT